MKTIFVNPINNKFRAGWRIFFFVLLFWIFSALIFVIKPLFDELTKREFIEGKIIIIPTILIIALFIMRWWSTSQLRTLGQDMNTVTDLRK